MKPEGKFIAERLAAMHCAELTRPPRPAANPLGELEQFGERLAQAFAERLAVQFNGAAVKVAVGEATEMQASVNERRGEPVFNSTFSAGPAEATVYTSLPQGAALAMVDVALGGDGKNCEYDGAKLPGSAQLMFERFEGLVAGALAEAFELGGAEAVKLRKTGATPEATLPLFGCKRNVITIRLSLAQSSQHELVVTFPGTSLATLCAGRGPAGAVAHKGGGVVAPNAEPFAGIPLPLKAILVDMAMPVSVLAGLKPGALIPVAVARSVPLIVGDQTIAHGSVGSLDDRIALQLTKISLKKEN